MELQKQKIVVTLGLRALTDRNRDYLQRLRSCVFHARRCPTGDHVHTLGVTDVQRINCSGEVGVFTLNFRDGSTTELPFHASAIEMEAALEATPWLVTALHLP